MFKKFIITICLVLLFIPSIVSAHATLEESNPAQNTVVTTDVEELVLTFNSNLEKGSSLKLHKGGKQMDITSNIIKGTQLVAKLTQPLENGKYTVEWNIIGEDGHPIDGNYSFTVEKKPTESNTVKNVDNKQEKVDTKTSDATNATDNFDGEKSSKQNSMVDVETKVPDTQSAQESDDEFSSGLIVIVIILLIVAATGFGWLMIKGRR